LRLQRGRAASGTAQKSAAVRKIWGSTGRG